MRCERLEKQRQRWIWRRGGVGAGDDRMRRMTEGGMGMKHGTSGVARSTAGFGQMSISDLRLVHRPFGQGALQQRNERVDPWRLQPCGLSSMAEAEAEELWCAATETLTEELGSWRHGPSHRLRIDGGLVATSVSPRRLATINRRRAHSTNRARKSACPSRAHATKLEPRVIDCQVIK